MCSNIIQHIFIAFQETLQRVCHIARTIMSPHDVGHATLVAEGNPGLSNLFARLAAHLCGFSVFEVNPSPMSASVTYKLDQFKADLVAAYTKAGVKVIIWDFLLDVVC